MEKTLRLSADQREDLVAYLDGELPDGKAQQIDQVLARSEVARYEVEALARTWELLDVLPTPKAPPEFTERTMTTLKVAEVPFDITEQPWFGPLKKVAIVCVWIAALGASGWFGFRITNEWVANPTRQMLEDLPTLQKLDLYQEVESIDFLDKISRIFDETSITSNPTAGVVSIDAKTIPERHDLIVKMSKIERDRLQRNVVTFQQLRAEEQDHYRQLNNQIEEEKKKGRHLSSIMQTYSAWLQTLSPSQREDLRLEKNSAKKLDLVHRFKEEQYHRIDAAVTNDLAQLEPPRPFQFGPKPLTPAELNAVMKVLVEELPAEDHEKFARLNKPEQYVDILRRNIHQSPNPRVWPSAELQEKILNAMPSQDRNFIKRNPQMQRAAMLSRISRSVITQVYEAGGPKFPKEAEINQFLSEMDEKQRAALDQKPADERRRELTRRYLEKHDPKTYKHLQELMSGMGKVMSELGLSEPFGPPRGQDGRNRPGGPRDNERPPERPPERPRPEVRDNRKN